jgi:hypothetical protein
MPIHFADLPTIEAIIHDSGKRRFVVLGYDAYKKLISRVGCVGDIDEDAYKKKHGDIAKAIQEKKIVSAREHYAKHGYFEKREVVVLPKKPV